MKWPEDLTTSRNLAVEEFFEISYSQSDEALEELQELGLTEVQMGWHIEEIGNDYIEIGLDFSNPTLVSLVRTDQDKIKFKLLKPDQFISAISGKTVDFVKEIDTYVPQ